MAPGSRILHLADLHLGGEHPSAGPRAPERRDEADRLLERLADRILKGDLGIGAVVIAGDLFDRHDPPASLAGRVENDLRRLEQSGIHVLTVPGNHDELSYPSGVYRERAGSWPGTLVVQPAPARVAQWTLGGRPVVVYAMAFVAGRSAPPYDQFDVAGGEVCRLAVLHGSLDAPWSDRSLPLRSAALEALGLDYVALGHIHRPMDRRLGRGWISYAGRIEGGSFDDPGGADLVVYDPAEAEPRPRRIPWSSRPISDETWELSGLERAEELAARFAEAADSTRILRVRLEGHPPFPIDLPALRERHAAAFYALELVASDAPAASLELALAEPTIRGAFARRAQKGIDAARDDDERALARAALRHGLAAFAADESGERP